MILSAIAERLKRQSKDDFKGRHFEAWLIVQAVTWYLRYPLSYRDLEEMFRERGFEVDHSTAKAAKRLMRKLLKGQGRAPRVMVTDKLRSYDAAKREVMPGVEHRSHKGLNNRAENSHQPIRTRERIMKRFKSQRYLQRFISIHDPIANLFHIPRHHISASHYRELRTTAMSMWAEVART